MLKNGSADSRKPRFQTSISPQLFQRGLIGLAGCRRPVCFLEFGKSGLRFFPIFPSTVTL
jgi:hypothetical protein